MKLPSLLRCVAGGLSLAGVFAACFDAWAGDTPVKLYSGKPLQVLLITGGCCHNYAFQAMALTNAVMRRADSQFTVVNEGGTGTKGQIAMYDRPDWAGPYDVVVHNECFADTTDAAYIRRITAAHVAGKPAVVVHCAMHTYRAAQSDDWRGFLGVTSRYHENQGRYPVKVVAPDHPVMRGLANNWTTPMDELYVIEKLWPNAQALATSVSQQTGQAQPVVWVNNYHGTRVFGTTYGHSDDTFRDPNYLELLSRGIVWAAEPKNGTREGSGRVFRLRAGGN